MPRKATARERGRKRSKARQCKNPDCRSAGASRRAYCRGLCEACYRTLNRLVKLGRITARQAEERGLWLPPKGPGSDRFPSITAEEAEKRFGERA